jgi:uncharacterized protein
VIELAIAAVVIILDLLIPTLVILGILAISLLVRKEKLATISFKRPAAPGKMFIVVLLMVVLWTLLQLGLFMPVLNHLTGTTQDLSAFEGLKGEVGQLAFLLIATWPRSGKRWCTVVSCRSVRGTFLATLGTRRWSPSC